MMFLIMASTEEFLIIGGNYCKRRKIVVKYIYKVDSDNRSVTCIGINKDNNCMFENLYMGEAKCHKEDEFDIEYGMELAKLRCEKNQIKHDLNRTRRKVTKCNKRIKILEECANKAAASVSMYKRNMEGVDGKINKLLSKKK